MNFSKKTGWVCASLAVLAMALFCSVTTASAQVATATLFGEVTDPQGAVVVGAKVTLRHLGTGTERTVETDSTGRYQFLSLAPGRYDLKVEMQGFRIATVERIDLAVNTTARFNVSLEIGELTETVVVAEAAAVLNTTDASLGSPFSGEAVRNLPSLDLNPAGLLSLQAGVTFVPSAADGIGGYSGVNLSDHRGGSVSGSRSDQSNVTLDGIDVNDPQTGAAFFSALRVTQESLQEFRVTTSSYNADQGRSSAAQVSLVTKSGTNELHGSGYYLHRNEAFNANDFFLNRAGTPEGKFRRHLYGATLGGPVIRNRFFLFGNWERMTESIFESATRSVPSLHMRDGVFIYPCSNRTGFAACPSTATTVQGLTATWPVPANHFGLSPANLLALDRSGQGINIPTINAWKNLPEPNDTGTADRRNLLGFRFAAPINNTFNTYILRGDFHIDAAAKHIVFWRGTMQDDTQLRAPALPGGPPFRSILVGNKGFASGYTWVISSTKVNNFRYGLTRLKDDTAGLRNSSFVRHRFVDDTLGFFTQENGTSSSSGRIIPQHHFRNDFSWTRGSHVLGFGGEARYTRNNRFSNAASFHIIVINPSWLPDGGGEVQPGHSQCSAARPECAQFPNAVGRVRDHITLLFAPLSQVSANYNFDRTGATLPDGSIVRRRFAVDEYEFYAQDQWRMNSTMTLTYGLRWSYATPPWETNGNQVVPNPRISEWFDCRVNAMNTGQPSRLACGGIEMVLGGKENKGRPYYDPDKNNWSPRVAFAWAPRNLGWLSGQGKMTVRIGYSLLYDRMGNALAVSFDQLGSFGLATSLSNGLGSCSIGGAVGRPICPRFNGYLTTAAGFAGAGPGRGLQPSPGASFPAVPPRDLSGVASIIDDKLRTPYSHAGSFSVARDLPGGLVLEAAWVGRFSNKVPIARDYAMPADLRDPVSGMTAFEASRLLIQAAANGVPLNAIGTIPFWEKFFANTWGPSSANGGCLGWEVLGTGCGFTATQVAYDYVMGYHGLGGNPGFGTSTVWEDIDRFQFPGLLDCGQGAACRYAFFPGQWVQLRGLASIARAEYSSFQLTLRKRMSHGLLFNLNYTLSTSRDHSSVPERAGTSGSLIGAGYSGFLTNTWELEQSWGYSDFDMRHQINAHWVYEMPFGRGKMWASGVSGWLNQIIGGWTISGIFRGNSGLPLTVINGRTWPTNWNFQGNGVCSVKDSYVLGLSIGPCPPTQNVKNSTRGGPNAFADPADAFRFFRFGATGESGDRNLMRGDKYLNIDFGISKTFSLPLEGHSLEFRWDMFNMFNSAYFDTGAISASVGDPGTFGDYRAVIGGPRRMQLRLRYFF